MEIIYLIVGLALGCFSGWWIHRLRMESSTAVSGERVAALTREIENLRQEASREQQTIVELNRQLSSKEADYRNIRERLQDQKAEIEKLQEKFNLEFKNLANEIFEEKSRKFTEQNKTNLTDLLKPLNEKIKDFEKRVEETYDKESKQRFSLQNEIKNLVELNQKISTEANNLTKALRGQAKTRGNWGEMILENILEKSGLVRDREYFIQPSFTDAGGRRLQPDVIVHYPGERNIIIDSKVSLVAYERYVHLESEDEQEQALREHLQSLRNHINDLSSKNYQDLYGLKSLDFAMMFLPVEPAYLLAMQKDPDLWSYAYDRRLLLISPTNLIAALKMVASLWRQEYQNRNALEIAQQSGNLYDKFVALVEDLIEVGKKIESTQKTYKDAMTKLYEGKGNLIKRAQDIQKLGAKTKKNMPQALLDRIDEDDTGNENNYLPEE